MMDQRFPLSRRAAKYLGSTAMLLGVAFTACSNGASTSVAPVESQPMLPTAIATSCIDPSTSPQTAPLPSAGGVTGTISIGGFSVASRTCLVVTVATGADATDGAPSSVVTMQRPKRLDSATSTLPAPITSISLTNTYTGNTSWVAVTVSVPAGSIPAGTYPARIISTLDLGDGQQDVTFKNFTVVVSAAGVVTVLAPKGSNVLAILAADTTGTLVLYPQGTVLATPAPNPSQTPSPLPSVTPTQSATPVTSPTPLVTPSPPPANPTPTPTPTLPPNSPGMVYLRVTAVIAPSTCIDTGYAGATVGYQATVSAPPPPGTSYIYAWSALALQPAWTVVVPPPTQNLQYGIGGGDTAQVIVPPFGMTGQTGESGAMEMQLYLSGTAQPYYGINVVLDASGSRVEAGDTIAAGSVTCASLGLNAKTRVSFGRATPPT